MKNILILVLLNSLFCVSLFGVDVTIRLQNNPLAIWNMPASGIQKEFNSYGECRWKDNTKNYLLFTHTPGKKKIYFFNHPISKASFCFVDKKIHKNAGRAQEIRAIYFTLEEKSEKTDKDIYLKDIDLLKDQIKNIGNLSRGRSLKRESGKWYRYTYLWNSSQYSASLKWSYASKTPFEIKPTLFTIFYNGTPFPSSSKKVETKIDNEKVAETKAVELPAVSSSEPQTSRTTADKNDFYLKVPMFVESSSRNSLGTSVSRIMKFYDQEAAKKSPVVKTDNPDPQKYVYNFSTPENARYDIEKLLKKSFKVKEVMSPECFEDYIKFSSLINTYNGYTKDRLEGQFYKIKNSKGRLKSTDYLLMKVINRKVKTGTVSYVNNGRSSQKNMYKDDKLYVYLINMVEIILKMNDEPAWLKARTKRDSDIKKFKKNICRQILDGKPVLWDVILGVVSEKNAPEIKGKHVRIITGYNDKTDEVIYSDNLGNGHEIKKMPWDKAWAITYKTLIITAPKRRF